MVTVNFILAIILGSCIAWATYTAVLNWRRFKANQQIAEDLDAVLKSTLEVVARNKKIAAAKSKNPKTFRLEDFYESGVGPSGDLESPEMLSTLLTVIIHKYGTAQISLNDFLKVPDEEYISVYVDTASKKLILSMDHEMGSKNPMNIVNFSNPDDNTFH
jgi:hypothetical protein